MNFVEFLRKTKGFEPKLPDHYGEWLGYEIEDVDGKNGLVKTSLKIREEHLSPSGAVHGGVISGFLDFTCGCAVFGMIEKNQLCSTVDLGVKYFKPLLKDDEIIAEAKVLHKGKTLSSVEAHLYRKSDMKTVVAMATGTFNIYTVKR